MKQPRGGGASDLAAVIAIASGFAVGGLIWLWGGLAGALFGDGWPRPGVAELFGVLTRLPAHLGNPAGAWPAKLRALLPGPAGCYGALLLLGAAGLPR